MTVDDSAATPDFSTDPPDLDGLLKPLGDEAKGVPQSQLQGIYGTLQVAYAKAAGDLSKAESDAKGARMKAEGAWMEAQTEFKGTIDQAQKAAGLAQETADQAFYDAVDKAITANKKC
jgi:hypothetical protein